MAFIRSIDPKLKYTVLTFVAARLALELGISWDPTTEAIVAGVVASFVGYAVPNDGTVLRTPQESGNPEVPKGVNL
jgi:hypothetical protein